MLIFDESSRGLSEILIASDYQRTKALFAIEMNLVIGIFDKVGNDEVRTSHATFDNSVGDYRIENS